MLYEAMLTGSQLFHVGEPAGGFYDDYMADKRWHLWEHADTLDLAEIERLVLFLNQWRTHYENSQDSRSQLLGAIRRAFPLLQALAGRDIINVDFSQPILPDTTTAEAIEQVFETIASCGRRYESTGTAKIIHTINPRLFVMWDTAICAGYAVNGRADDYARRFLPRMQRLLRRAVAECMQTKGVSQNEAAKTLCQCGHTLAKVADEYNYAKFTLKRDEVWDAELA